MLITSAPGFVDPRKSEKFNKLSAGCHQVPFILEFNYSGKPITGHPDIEASKGIILINGQLDIQMP